MQVPLELSFHNMDHSEFVEERVRERVAKLERIYPRLVSCRVVVEAPHRQHQQGNIFRVRVFLSVPGDELVASKEPNHARERWADPDVYAVLRDAFDVAERQLKAFKEKQRGDVKVHAEAMHGTITHVEPEKDFGFLLDVDGGQIYFHRNALINDALEDVKPGDQVHYVETVGETGLQASRVWKVGSEHQKRHTETGPIEPPPPGSER